VSGPRARMFVALDLPGEARSAVASWRDELVEGRHDLRPVRAEALHVTLVFLGWQDENAAGAIGSAAFEACAGMRAPRLRAAGVRPLPPRNPRLFALDLEDEDGRAAAVQQGISDALEAGRWYRPEKRPFWPHLTVARVRPERRGSRKPALVESPPGPLPERTFLRPIPLVRLVLFRSHLRREGALYEPMAELELPTGDSKER
jgi:RNA 2',3'-cyclic 3'-phosphodiesterase